MQSAEVSDELNRSLLDKERTRKRVMIGCLTVTIIVGAIIIIGLIAMAVA